ncbi:putative amidoligase domain-containing protein [Paenibacillus thalictri]|uniref:Phage phiEco32-like COOH-NH2 ligase-type 2 n=1 Tax=Paenibacillus thalictri TaxID=2527873 RepID=A0A4Q9DTC8_9BACL|nr:hypothetical protein [Paenibacillus thalictri]TBL80186.1 hypothetical protein EYB31_07130 [Paenibacillus thalictri]
MTVAFIHSNEPRLRQFLKCLAIPHTSLTPEPGTYETLIQWGGFVQEQPGQRRLQPVQSVLRTRNAAKTSQLLRLHGMKPELDKEPSAAGYAYLYQIPVFHLEPLAVFERRHTATFYHSSKPQPVRYIEMEGASGFHAGRAKREAVKAIYALGLDYGIVTVGVRDAMEPVDIVRVDAEPKLTGRWAELFADAMFRYGEELQRERELRERPLTIGMDPEFLLRDHAGEVVFASQFMDKEGKAGCDSIVLPDRSKVYPLVELRPLPSPDIRELIINLQRTMQLAARKIGDSSLEWLAGGMPVKGFPLGGHIHFGNVQLNVHLLRALDNYVALPLLLLEDVTTGQRRPKYGFLGDFRRKSSLRFEYRTLPSWILSPAVTKGTLALAKLVATHYLELTRLPLQYADVQVSYYNGDKAALRDIVTGLWGELEALPSYAQYRAYLEPFKKLVMDMKSWDEQVDFRKRWKITPANEKSSADYQIMV